MAFRVQLNGMDYTVSLNRKSFIELERRGFKLSDLEEKPLSSTDEVLKQGLMTNSSVTYDEADKLVEQIYDEYDFNDVVEHLKSEIENVFQSTGEKKKII